MDPNPKSFPILSYVMSRLHSKPQSRSQSQSQSDIDIEQPAIQSRLSVELVNRLPHLSDPILLASMKYSVADVASTRSVLQALGDRPDHESVDIARSRIAQIDELLSKSLQEIVLVPRPPDVDPKNWRAVQAEEEKRCRAKAEKEKVPYKAVIQLDEMHEAYEKLLKVAEEKLVTIYEGASAMGAGFKEEENCGEEMNGEVVEILREASGKCVGKVELSGRQLRFLPEAFGRIRGLVLLDVSSNQLEVT